MKLKGRTTVASDLTLMMVLFACNISASYRKAQRVDEVLMTDYGQAFPVCPRCKISMEREFMSYCDRCGQRLDWINFPKSAAIRTARDRKIDTKK